MFLSFRNTYRDIYTHNEIRFSDLFGLMDDTIYNVEITEMPVELYPSFYLVKIGENALLVTGIDDELEEFKRTGSVKVRGKLYAFSDEEKDIGQSAWDYFSRYGYYEDNSKIKKRVAGHYLKCSDFSFIGILRNDHPIGIIFGLTILIINSMIMSWEGTLYVIRHLRPVCGSVRYTPQELDEQAQCQKSQWLEYEGLYFTPEILIGTQKGMTAVRYDDIEKIYIRKRLHINWATSPNNSLMRSGGRTYAATKAADNLIWATSKDSEYYTYQLVVVSKNHRKLIMCEVTNIDQSLIDCIRKKIGMEENGG